MDADNRTDTWHMSNEREFIENLLYQRVNFFIVFYSLILTSAVSARQQLQLTIVLILGAFVCILLAASIYMLQQKLEILICLVRKDVQHPAKLIYDKLTGKRWLGTLHEHGVDRKVIGYCVPGICALSLLLGAFLSLGHVIKAVR